MKHFFRDVTNDNCKLKIKLKITRTYIIPEQNKSILAGVSGNGTRSFSVSCYDTTIHFRWLRTPVDCN